jgi:hypothetical protein
VKVQYTAIFKLVGVSKLPEGTECTSLFTLQSPVLAAVLTTNPEPYFLHIDKSLALGTQGLKGLFAPDKGSLQDLLAAEIEDVKARRVESIGSGVFLIFEGETDIPNPAFKYRRDSDEFGVCLNGIEKAEIRERFRPSVQRVITALSLSLPTNADRGIEKAGDVVHLIDDGKPIYSFALYGSARASVSSPLSHGLIAESAALAAKIATNETMTRITSLLMISLDDATDELQGFIAAWSALEIFINANFKGTYEARLFEIMEDGAPASSKPVFERFKDVMSDKYRLADKFLVITSVLDSGAATHDATEFGRLKKFRDGLLHALDTASSSLPTEAVQKLLLKYMKLHLTTQG